MPATQLAAYGRAASAPAGMLPWREQVLRTQPTALAPLRAGWRRRLTVCVRGRAALPSSSAVPNSSERSLGGPVTVSSGCGNRRLRDHGRPADAGGAPGRDTRTRGKRRDPTVPSVESEPPASAVLAPVAHARDWRTLDAPRQSVPRAGLTRSGDAARSCRRCARPDRGRPPAKACLVLPLCLPCY